MRVLTAYAMCFHSWQVYAYRSGRDYAELIDGIPHRPLRWIEMHKFKQRAKAAFIRRLKNARIQEEK